MLLPVTIQVRYKGAIQGEDAPSKISEYDFFVLTSEGENFGHSILEAMTEGLPVIISDRTPWIDLEQQKVGWDVNVRNTKDLTSAINMSLSLSQQEYAEFSLNSYNYVLKHPKSLSRLL